MSLHFWKHKLQKSSSSEEEEEEEEEEDFCYPI